MPQRHLRRTKSIMRLAFAIVAVCLAILAFVEYAQEMRTRRAIAGIQQNAVLSVELAHRIGDDLHSEQLLLDKHVFEHDAANMNRIEKKISELREDYEDAARRYEALPAMPVEVAAWRALTSDVAVSRLKVAPVMELSRENRIEESVAKLQDLEPLYEKITTDEARLDDINQAESSRAVADVRRIQMTSIDVRLTLFGVVLLTVVAIGRWTSRSALKAQQDLATVNKTLAERNRDLDAFAGRLAHDLRGPLGVIDLSSGLLAERFPEARPTTATMERSVAQIANLIDELLTLSRLGTMPNATARSESVAAAVAPRLEPLVADAGGTLRIDLQPAQVACSESLLCQVLWNLGENSVKYRRPDVAPSISIEGRVDGDRYRIVASDNGMGMTDSDAKRAFEPFFRGGHSKVPGTGLGLAIVRRIIEATHGTITLESHLGEGSTFTMSIPLAGTRVAERDVSARPPARTTSRPIAWWHAAVGRRG